MMRSLRWFVVGLVMAVAAFAGAAQAERRVALVIGNSNYSDTSSLANPANDARLMTTTLQQVGFEVTTLIDADLQDMKGAMLEFGRELRSGVDASLFYYAGHGVQADGLNYLIPVDAAISDESELDFQSVDVNSFLRVMERSSSRVNIVVLDACRNNPYESSFRSSSRGLAMVDAPKGTYIAYSTAPGEVAEDGTGGNSPYTTALANAITSPGQKIEDAFKAARADVLTVTADRQVPWETSSITGDFYFVPTEGAPIGPLKVQTGPPDMSASVAWTAIQGSSNPSDFQAFVETFGEANPFLRGLAENRIRDLIGSTPPVEEQVAVVTPTDDVVAPPPVRPTVRSDAELVPQTGHHDWIRQVSWSPDGTRIISASDDNTVRLWDVATGKTLRIMEEHEHWVRSAVWAPDGRRFASGAQDGLVVIWDARSGQIEYRIKTNQSGVLSVAWSPDGHTLAVGGYGGEIEFRNTHSGGLISEIESAHSDWIRSVAWSPDGTKVVSGSDDGSAKIWRVDGTELLHTLSGHEDYVNSVAWSPDGTLIASGSNDDTARLWDAGSGQLVQKLTDFTNDVKSVAFSPDSERLATNEGDHSARIWSRGGQLLRSFTEEYETVQTVAWSPDGRVLATGGSADRVKLWDPDAGALDREFGGEVTSAQLVALAPDGDRLAVTDGRGINIWSISGGRQLLQIDDSGSEIIKSLAWSPRGDRMATGGSSSNVKIYDTNSGSLLAEMEGHEDWIRSVAWSPDGNYVASGADNGTVLVWDSHAGRQHLKLEDHTDWLRAVAWSPDGRTIASGADDKKIKVFDAGSGALQRTIEVEDRPLQLVFLLDSRGLVSVPSSNDVAHIWNTATGEKESVLEVTGGRVHAAAKADDDRGVIVGNTIWEEERQNGRLAVRSGQVRQVFWGDRGRLIGTLVSDGSVKFWDATDRRLLMSAFYGDDGEYAAMYPDGTAYTSPKGEHLFAVVADGQIMDGRSGYESLFRQSGALPR